MTKSRPLLILGASARAAAFSALRAGRVPVCGDLFADADLAANAAVTRVPGGDYPRGLLEIARSAPPGPWMFTGALENHPELVDQINRCGFEVSAQGGESGRPLWGNGPDVLRAVRDPLQVAACLDGADLPHPACRPDNGEPPGPGTWLRKPRASAGGWGIRRVEVTGQGVLRDLMRQDSPTREPRHATRDRAGWYWQEFVPGTVCAAVYVADGKRAALLGVTRQLVGEPAFYTGSFSYCGSIGPLPLDRRARDRFIRLGNVLARRFGLLGLFGVDAVLRDGVPWPVEVNPRYTASVEVLEYASGRSALAVHRDVFEGELDIDRVSREWAVPRSTGYVGKAILFAPEAIHVPDTRSWAVPGRWRELPDVADVPQPGQTIEPGHPVLTVFARADSPDACKALLKSRAAELYASLV